VPAERVGLELVAHERVEPVEALSHVGGAGGDEDAGGGGEPEAEGGEGEAASAAESRLTVLCHATKLAETAEVNKMATEGRLRLSGARLKSG
jgi:hypothetical protein